MESSIAESPIAAIDVADADGSIDHPGWESRIGATVLHAAAVVEGWITVSVLSPGREPVVMAVPALA